MSVDVNWARRNLGIDEAATAPDARTSAVAADRDQALARELIEFDSETAPLEQFAAGAHGASTGLSRFVEVDWPKGLAPVPGAKPTGESLPRADVLILTWTADEGHALSRVLTPGFDSKNDWKPYTSNFAEIAKDMRNGAPALRAQNLGKYWTTKIGSRTVTLLKCESHMSQDGPKLPNARVWKQAIEECKPKWVLTTGTGGGIGPSSQVGDVIVSRFVTFDCKRTFKRFDGDSFAAPSDPPSGRFAEAKKLFEANAKFLPADNSRAPKIVTSATAPAGILTTDFFGFDNTEDTYGLEGKGDLSEMGDAVLGMVCKELGTKAPPYTIVRNVSDPQINSKGLSLEKQAAFAADIYKGYGRWSSVCSALVCWAIVSAL